MASPGNPSTDCPRCGGDRVQIGHDEAVIGVHCDTCRLTVVLTGEAMTMHDEMDAKENWNPEEWEPSGSSYGPDPWG